MSRWVGGLVLLCLSLWVQGCSKYQQPAAFPDEKKCNFDKSTEGFGAVVAILGGVTAAGGGGAYAVSASQPGAEAANATNGASGKSVALAVSLVGLGLGVAGLAVQQAGSHDFIVDGCGNPRSGGTPEPASEKEPEGAKKDKE